MNSATPLDALKLLAQYYDSSTNTTFTGVGHGQVQAAFRFLHEYLTKLQPPVAELPLSEPPANEPESLLSEPQ